MSKGRLAVQGRIPSCEGKSLNPKPGTLNPLNDNDRPTHTGSTCGGRSNGRLARCFGSSGRSRESSPSWQCPPPISTCDTPTRRSTPHLPPTPLSLPPCTLPVHSRLPLSRQCPRLPPFPLSDVPFQQYLPLDYCQALYLKTRNLGRVSTMTCPFSSISGSLPDALGRALLESPRVLRGS
jgi:hypothetical protein